MTKHTQSILLFGLILPMAVLLAALGGVFFVRGKIADADQQKAQAYSTYADAKSKLVMIEGELTKDGRRDQMAYWEEQLGKDFIQSLTKNLNEITSDYDEDQLMRTELSQPNARSPIAGSTEHDFSRFKLSFEGGFSPMQKTMAELEMRMPQLVLESLEVTPDRNNVSGGIPNLRFDAVYLCWQDTVAGENRP